MGAGPQLGKRAIAAHTAQHPCFPHVQRVLGAGTAATGCRSCVLFVAKTRRFEAGEADMSIHSIQIDQSMQNWQVWGGSANWFRCIPNRLGCILYCNCSDLKNAENRPSYNSRELYNKSTVQCSQAFEAGRAHQRAAQPPLLQEAPADAVKHVVNTPSGSRFAPSTAGGGDVGGSEAGSGAEVGAAGGDCVGVEVSRMPV